MSERADDLRKLAEIVERMKVLRATMPQDSPLQSIAFQVQSLCGEVECRLLVSDTERGVAE